MLKDIFAELIVKQAYDIAKLRDRSIKGTKETIYFDNASIGVLPEIITENNIVVASSNNGAVQNIVNELPLTKEQIDQKFVEELKCADYFAVSLIQRYPQNGKKMRRVKSMRPFSSSQMTIQINFGDCFLLRAEDLQI